MAPAVPDEHAPVSSDRAGSAFELNAAALRSENGTLDATLHGLLAKLSGVPGLSVVATRRRPWWRRLLGDLPYLDDLPRRRGPIEAITVSSGEGNYRLVRAGASVRCTRERPGTPAEELPFGRWADALLADIEVDNRTSHESLLALRALVDHERAA
jgi:hypothetical protein